MSTRRRRAKSKHLLEVRDAVLNDAAKEICERVLWQYNQRQLRVKSEFASRVGCGDVFDLHP